MLKLVAELVEAASLEGVAISNEADIRKISTMVLLIVALQLLKMKCYDIRVHKK